MEVSGQLHTLATSPPGKEPLVLIGEEAGQAPELLWTRQWTEKFPVPAKNQTLIVQPVA
jgi:hypothetical protein